MFFIVLGPMLNRLLDPPWWQYRRYVRQPERVGADLRRLLVENILPFWSDCADEAECRGYRIHRDMNGADLGPSPATVVPQARMLWYFSRLARSPYGDSRDARSARAGFLFLQNQMWDTQHKGYVWQVLQETGEISRPEKVIYGQAFVLYALCEYYRVSRDPASLEAARLLFDLIDDRARDSLSGGYRDVHTNDWTIHPGPFQASYRLPVNCKNVDTHIHLLEAFVSLHRIAPTPLIRSRINELISILSQTAVVPRYGLLGNVFSDTWDPIPDIGERHVSYAHSIEAVWLLLDACDAIAKDNLAILSLGERIFDACLDQAFDHRHGGLIGTSVPFARSQHFTRSWWVQSEALASSAVMYWHTSEGRYRNCFLKLLAWIVSRQADWKVGEWYAHARVYRRPFGPKACDWKAAYHNTRAVLTSLELERPYL